MASEKPRSPGFYSGARVKVGFSAGNPTQQFIDKQRANTHARCCAPGALGGHLPT